MRTILEARNPAYANVEETVIDLEVKFAEIIDNGEPVFIPFTATADDVESHGRELHTRAESGEFGTIQSYTPPE